IRVFHVTGVQTCALPIYDDAHGTVPGGSRSPLPVRRCRYVRRRRHGHCAQTVLWTAPALTLASVSWRTPCWSFGLLWSISCFTIVGTNTVKASKSKPGANTCYNAFPTCPFVGALSRILNQSSELR